MKTLSLLALPLAVSPDSSDIADTTDYDKPQSSSARTILMRQVGMA